MERKNLQQAEEAARLAEIEAKKAEEKWKVAKAEAEEAFRKVETAREAEAEAKRRAENVRREAEKNRREEAACKAEVERQHQEEEAACEAEAEKKRQEEARRLEEEKRRTENVMREKKECYADVKVRADEVKRKAEAFLELVCESHSLGVQWGLSDLRKAERAVLKAETNVSEAEKAVHEAEKKWKAAAAQVEEAARKAEEKRRAEEEARKAEEKRQAEEAAQKAEEKRQAQELAAKLCDEEQWKTIKARMHRENKLGLVDRIYLKAGMVVRYEEKKYLIIEVRTLSRGKGVQYTGVDLADIECEGKVSLESGERLVALRPGETMEVLNCTGFKLRGGSLENCHGEMQKSELIYLYHDADMYIFIDENTYDQFMLSDETVVDSLIGIKENDKVIMTFYDGVPFWVEKK